MLTDGIQYLDKITPMLHQLIILIAIVRTTLLLQFRAFFQNKMLR